MFCKVRKTTQAAKIILYITSFEIKMILQHALFFSLWMSSLSSPASLPIKVASLFTFGRWAGVNFQKRKEKKNGIPVLCQHTL